MPEFIHPSFASKRHQASLFCQIFNIQSLLIIIAQMLKLLLLSILYHLSFCQQSSTQEKPAQTISRFPHKLWIFWGDESINVTLQVQLCLNNIRHYAEISGWELIQFNSGNIFNYLGPDSSEKLRFIRSKKRNLKVEALTDIFRTFVLHDNGGMWLDLSSVLVHDLSWVDNLHNDKIIQFKPTLQPQMIMYVHNRFFGRNKTVIFDQKLQREVQVFPGLESYSFIAVKDALFLSDIIYRYVYMASKQNDEDSVIESEKQGNIYWNERELTYFYGPFVFQEILQRKQREIRTNPSRFKDQYAVQYYKIWTINGLQTTYLHEEINFWRTEAVMNSIFYESLETLTHQKKNPIYFLKLHHTHREAFHSTLSKSVQGSNSCLDTIIPFPNQSIISQYLLPHNQQLQQVQKLNSFQLREKEKCLFLSENFEEVNSFKSGSLVGLTFLYFVIFLLLWFCKTFKCRNPENDQFRSLQQD